MEIFAPAVNASVLVSIAGVWIGQGVEVGRTRRALRGEVVCGMLVQ
jgi:hypothetical protein